MSPSRDPVPGGTLTAWRGIVALVHARVAGRTDAELDHRAAADAMTLRETVWHVAEANVVAGGIVIAALGSPGCTFDWSWLMPFGPWWERLRYDRPRALAPALRLVEAINDYVAALVEPLADGLEREVMLRDEPNAALRRTTVAGVLLAEVEH